MIAEAVLGIVGGAAALGSILASSLGETKKAFWVLWINFSGNMVAKSAPGMPEAEALQQNLKGKGHSSVIVTKMPDGGFSCSNSVIVAAVERHGRKEAWLRAGVNAGKIDPDRLDRFLRLKSRPKRGRGPANPR
jgi:hypothetical protein